MKSLFRTVIQYSLAYHITSDNCKTKLFFFWSGISPRLLFLVTAIFLKNDVMIDDVILLKKVKFAHVEITSNKVSVTTNYATMM